MTLSHAEKQLIVQDPILGTVITSHGTLPLPPTRDYFDALASSIISQQISVKAAATIRARFLDATDMRPARFLELSESSIKTIGLSGRKSQYLRDLALHFVENPAVFDHLGSLPDDQVISELTRVKGIGAWTAQMFLLFTLQRPDIFAPDDRGLQLAAEKLYEKSFSRSELEILAERWKPYRSTASLHLWRSLDNTPV